MYITPVNTQTSSNSKINFKSIKEITKKMLENTPRTVTKTICGTITESPEKIKELIDVDNILKRYGITHINTNFKQINLTAGQYGFFTFKTLFIIPRPKLKSYVATLLDSPTEYRDLHTYVNCVNDLKRQDIIMRGAGIQTYELNMLVPEEKRNNMKKCYAKYFEKDDFDEELFFINNSAFYYDFPEKTLYAIHTDIQHNCITEQNITKCKFVTDEKGNAVGYDKKWWDIYAAAFKEVNYREQSEPSQELPKIVDPKNNKILAESFRFGNAKKSTKTMIGTQKALEHLRDKAKISMVDENQLQYVRFYDKNKEIVNRISYFNPVSGRSIIYNERGDFMYQLEYLKDHEGAIRACSRL